MSRADAQVSAIGSRRVWVQTAVISVAAVGLFVIVRALPVGGAGDLHYSDFGAGQRGFLEFCEPGSPQFAPVDRVASPVILELIQDGPLRVDQEARVTARLATASGKQIAIDDLLEVHTRKLHLLLVDGSLDDYQHVHPEPAGSDGEFVFSFTPRRAGPYRVFADFMPRATGRSLYAAATLPAVAATSETQAVDTHERLSSEVNGLRFNLTLEGPPRINQSMPISLTIARADGGDVELEELMGAPAHLVAFDEGCTGFAHLHPARSTPGFAERTDAGRRLAFTINLPTPGYYRLWAQVQIEGRELFAPFGIVVQP